MTKNITHDQTSQPLIDQSQKEMDAPRRNFSKKRASTLRIFAGYRKWLAVLFLLVPMAFTLVIDFRHRWGRQDDWQTYQFFTYFGAIVESLIIWSVLLIAAARRRGRARFFYRGLFIFLLTLTWEDVSGLNDRL